MASTKLNQEPDSVRRQLQLLNRLEVVQVNRSLIDQGLDLRSAFTLSFWDGVILAAAIASRCGTLISEDFTSDRTYAGVRVENPFAT